MYLLLRAKGRFFSCEEQPPILGRFASFRLLQLICDLLHLLHFTERHFDAIHPAEWARFATQSCAWLPIPFGPFEALFSTIYF